MNKNILYYSKFCRDCKSLIFILKNNNLTNTIDEFFCIDNKNNNGIRPDIPNFLKMVPTLITTDYEEILDGENVFKWANFKIASMNVQRGIKEPEAYSCDNDGFCTLDRATVNKISTTEDILQEDNGDLNGFYGSTITGSDKGIDEFQKITMNGDTGKVKDFEKLAKMREMDDKLFGIKK